MITSWRLQYTGGSVFESELSKSAAVMLMLSYFALATMRLEQGSKGMLEYCSY